ncbi:MAG: DUF2007 domain-containing protein [Caulobacterales bacterium]|nr:DUF2007 domain-containing protein [Caulobacterales bacterium]
MIEILRTNDLVRLSWAEAMLADIGVEAIILDAHASVIEGSVSAIERRLMVAREDADRARAALREAEARDRAS